MQFLKISYENIKNQIIKMKPFVIHLARTFKLVNNRLLLATCQLLNSVDVNTTYTCCYNRIGENLIQTILRKRIVGKSEIKKETTETSAGISKLVKIQQKKKLKFGYIYEKNGKIIS